MKKYPGLLLCCGAAIAIAVSYDASALAALFGVDRYGGEGVVALIALVLAALLVSAGGYGLLKRWTRGSSPAAR
jgi:hypothetical protein